MSLQEQGGQWDSGDWQRADILRIRLETRVRGPSPPPCPKKKERNKAGSKEKEIKKAKRPDAKTAEWVRRISSLNLSLVGGRSCEKAAKRLAKLSKMPGGRKSGSCRWLAGGALAFRSLVVSWLLGCLARLPLDVRRHRLRRVEVLITFSACVNHCFQVS